jgi:2-oxoglutarate ferredoxin oxidoreductase subunit beta
MVDKSVYASQEKSTWCPGCGDFPILAALQRALIQLDIEPHEIIIVSGIGCGSKLPHYIRCNGFHTLHGRALPVAFGVKLANRDLEVITVTGDGDGYGIGGNHFIHMMRRNPDILHIVENNQVYGLTKGQFSPTSDYGYVTKTSPEGTIEQAINPLSIALCSGATFIARGFSGDIKHLTDLLVLALQHKGYKLIDILQPCVTFNRQNTYDWYKERVYKLEEEADYDPQRRDMALQKTLEWGEAIPIGLIYKAEGIPTFEEQIPVLEEGPLFKQPLNRKVRREWELIKDEYL